MHEDTRHTIERQVQRLATKLSINKQRMVFNIDDLVWLHLRKDRFPNECKSKLLPRADGPFKVLARYNDNLQDRPTTRQVQRERHLQRQGPHTFPW